jgi:serine/threonine protein kinase
MPTSSSSGEVLLERLAAEFVERYRKGERPPLSDYTERYPALATDIRSLFPALVQIEDLKPAHEPTGKQEPSTAPEGPTRLERLGDYRILREVGRGGMGVVYEAEQESLGRHVALKVLPPAAILSPTYLERFRREAKAAARLHHTNIVPVFGTGECDGVPYYAMQFIRGEGLDKVLADVRRLRQRPNEVAPIAMPLTNSIAHSLLTGQFAIPLSEGLELPVEGGVAASTSGLSVSGPEANYYRGVARIGLQAAEALAYAHRQGILHRDIKPSNLLLDQQGTVWVTDFGLAKAEGSEDLTQTGDIVGTLRYMAPERLEGQSLPQSDVYALGLTLYEMLTLRPALDDSHKAKLIEKVLHEQPVAPRKIDPRIPRDLETVVLKCLVKEPRLRYASAEAVVEDLQRFLADRPVQARRTPWYERSWRWCRRNPLLAALWAVVFVLLTVGTVVGMVLSHSRGLALTMATEAERTAKEKLFESYVSGADAKRMSNRPGQRFATLARVRDALGVAAEIGLSDKDRLRLRNIAIAALCLPDIEVGQEGPAGLNQPIPEEIDPVIRARGPPTWSGPCRSRTLAAHGPPGATTTALTGGSSSFGPTAAKRSRPFRRACGGSMVRSQGPCWTIPRDHPGRRRPSIRTAGRSLSGAWTGR